MDTVRIPKIIVFGSSGKVGSALVSALDGASYTVITMARSQCDVREHDQIRRSIETIRPDVVINAVAFNGIDACEDDPHQALLVNTLFPKLLAELSVSHGFLLVHISSDAVFSGTGNNIYSESSAASPINIYGLTKYGGDCFVGAIAKRYYIARISVQFGTTPGKGQFVEKMLDRIQHGCQPVRISDDIVASPSYSKDVAERIKDLVDGQSPFGLYHVANEGQASLYELVQELAKIMALDVVIEPVSHATFQSRGLKNCFTPISSEKMKPLRPWKEALTAYCLEIQQDKGLVHG